MQDELYGSCKNVDMNYHLKHIVLFCLALAPISVRADTVTVTTAAALRTAIMNARAGRIILVAPGNYGDVAQIDDKTFSPSIIIRAQNAANPPVFNGRRPIEMLRCRGVTFEDLKFNSTFRDSAGFNSGLGLELRRCGRMTVRRCHFIGGYVQLNMTAASSSLVEWNTFEAACVDAMRCYESHNGLTIRNNYFFGHNPSTVSGLHSDYIQFAVNDPNIGGQNITIQDNIFINDKNIVLQTVSFFNERLRTQGPSAWPACAYRNVTVKGNYIVGSHLNAIALWGVIGADVSGNTLRKGANAASGQVNTPGIHIYKGSDFHNGEAAWLQLSEYLEIHNNVAPQGNTSPAHEQGVVEQAGWSAFPDAQKPGTGNMSGNIISTSASVWPVGWVMPVAGR